MEKTAITLEKTLLPALLKCFGIMFLGYILGKFNILDQKGAKGLSIFVQYLSLPALIFITISTISFNNVKWEFIAAVFVTKAIVFMCVALMTILLTNPSHLGKSGIFAIAATQSNDFALGYPLLLSLYANSNPRYPTYVYIIAPIQLLLLNTIGFFFLETERQKHKKHISNCYFLHVLKGTLTNPIVLMTIIGMIWNITYGQKVLPIFDAMLKALSNAFAATALVLVGHTLAAKREISTGHISLTVALLVITKNLISALLLQKVSAFLLQGSSEKEIQSFSSFGFLYGTMPTAPTVYVFAVQYEMCIDVITKVIIGSTLFSAPLMFASASVISLSQTGIENTSFYLSQTISYISSINLLCCTWLLVLFLIGKRWKSISFGATLYFVCAQFFTAIGGVLLFFVPAEDSALFYAQYILSVGGIYATRMCVFLLAVLLLLIRWRSLCFILQIKNKINILSIASLILAFIITSAIITSENIKKLGPNCQLGFNQIITTFVITFLCFSGTILCLILQHVCFRKSVKHINPNLQNEVVQQIFHTEDKNGFKESRSSRKKDGIFFDNKVSVDVEDLGRNFTDETMSLLQEDTESNLCDYGHSCSVEKRLQCAVHVSEYLKQQEELDIGLYNNQQILQQTGILIALSVAMTVSLSVCFWKLVQEDVNGIFIELEFIDVIVNYSQGILFFITFGLDAGLLSSILIKLKILRLKKNDSNKYVDLQAVCDEFMRLHYKKCKIEIGQIKIINGIEYNNVFSSSDFIEWLIENNVVKEEDEAEMYGSCLLNADIIEKVDHDESFSKRLFIFKFSTVPLEETVIVM